MKQLIFFTDPGHGWLRVPYLETAGLGISRFSFTGQQWAYLEEDCDVAKYLDHLEEQDIEYNINNQNSDKSSFIRRLDRYAEPQALA